MSEALRAERVEAVRSAVCYESLAHKSAFSCSGMSDAVHTADVQLLAGIPSVLLAASYAHLRVGAAVAIATGVARQPRAWPGRLRPPSGGRRPRHEGTLGLRRPCEWHIALGPAGGASSPTGRTVVAVR